MSQAPELAPRRPLHLRSISCQAFERDDGLLDVEGLLVDTKTRSITLLDQREIPAGEVIHQMRVRLTVDLQRTIQDARVYSEIHPYPECPAVEAAYRQLIGMRIDPGFTREVKRMFKGVKGCSHMSEIITPLASTVFQALWTEGDFEGADAEGSDQLKSPLGQCHALRLDGQIVQRHVSRKPKESGS